MHLERGHDVSRGDAPVRGRPTKVINLMDALRRSVPPQQQQPARKQQGKRGRKRIEGQKEMLFPISGAGKKPAKEVARNPARSTGRRRLGERQQKLKPTATLHRENEGAKAKEKDPMNSGLFLLEIFLCRFEFGRVFFDSLFKRLSEIGLSLGYCHVGILYDCGI